MSEEQTPKKKGHCTVVAIVAFLALIFSIASLVMSALTLHIGGLGLNNGGDQEIPKIVISKQYDKGQSLKKAFATGKPVLAFFYADWCGYCQRFAPLYDKISKSDLKKDVAFAYINCEAPENIEYVKEYQIDSFPSVFVVKPDKTTKTKLRNETFFSEDSQDIITKNVRDLIK